MEVSIRKVEDCSEIPLELLLLADPSPSMIKDYINRGIGYLAYNQEVLVGAAVLLMTRPKTIEIVNISVKEEYQGRGVGKKMLQEAIKAAKDMEITCLEIGTGNSSIAQLALYQKMGFRIYSVEQNYFIHHYQKVIMENGIQCRDMIRLKMDI